ncbi:MAG: histidine triad nucleotide-binding protein [Thermoanaerobaculum sp.]|nr:histidine triad nucleotide-binding protein [Thermoanaerobaculum sp.]
MNDCVFCRIAAHQAPAQMLFEDEEVLAFHDIAPRAPVHVLVIPRKHIVSLADAQPEDALLLGKLLLAVQRVARETGVASAFRVVTNCGAGAGQSVFHLHFHVLAGRRLAWPPG